MRAITGVTLFCLLAGLVNSFRPITFQPGSVLRYKYEGSLYAGLPELSDQYSAFQIKADLVFHPLSPGKVAFKFENVLLGKRNDEIQGSEGNFQHTFSQEYNTELSKPVVFYYQKGVVEKFESEKTDKTWSVNIKKSILSMFSLDLTKSNKPSAPVTNYVPNNNQDSSVYSVYEDGIGGECETYYTVLSVPSLDDPDTSSDVLNVTKTRNFKNCLHRPTYEYDNFERQGCPSSCSPHKPISHVPGYPASLSERLSPYKTGCPYGFEPDHHPVKSYSFTEYNISSASHAPYIESIIQIGTTLYTVNGDEYVVYIGQNVTLARHGHAVSTVPRLSQPVLHESLTYTLPSFNYDLDLPYLSIFGHIHPKEILDTIRVKLESVVDDIIPDEPETSQKAGTKIIELVNGISVLKRDQLEILYSGLEREEGGHVPKKHVIMRKIFLDLLAIVPTNEAAYFASQLIQSGRVSTWEAMELIEAIGHNIAYPDEELLEHFWQLVQKPKIVQQRPLFTSAVIAFGKLVREACIKPKFTHYHEAKPPTVGNDNLNPYMSHLHRTPRHIPSYEQGHKHFAKDYHWDRTSFCDSEKAKGYIRALAHKLEQSTEVREVVAYIEALAHTSSPLALKHLEPYVSGEAKFFDTTDDDDDDFVRQVTIYALYHISSYHPREVLPLLVPVYFDQSESYHIRIAAFTILVRSKPPLAILHQIAAKLWQETNNQVGSYVYSTLLELGNATTPCTRKLAQKIQAIIPLAKPFDLGIHYSQHYRSEYYDDEKDFGYVSNFKWTANNESYFPRAGYFNYRSIAGPFRSDAFEFGFNAKGVETLIKKIIEPSGVLSQVISDLGSNVQTANVKGVLSMIKEKLGTTDDDSEDLRASIFYKLFGRTSYISLDEAFVLHFLEDVIEWFKTIDTTGGISGHYVKVWMPDSFFKVVPSALGVPVVINHRQPIIFSLIIENARFASNAHKAARSNSAFALSTVIRPSLHVSSVVLAYGVSPAEKILYGAASERVYEISLPVEINMAFDHLKYTVAFSFKPKLPHEIFYHETRPLTFQSKALLIDVPKSEWLDNVNEIETIPDPFKYDKTYISKAMGVEMRIKAETEDVWSNIPFWLSDTAFEDGYYPALLEVLQNLGITPREYHVFAEGYPKSPASEFVVTLKYDKTFSKTPLPTDRHVDASSYPSSSASGSYSGSYSASYSSPSPYSYTEADTDDTDMFHEYPEVMSKIYPGYGKGKHPIPTVEDTIGELMKKTRADWSPVLSHEYSEPVPATVSHLWYLTTVVKGVNPKHVAWKLLYAHTLDHRNIWFKLEGHKSGSEGYQGKPWKVCFDAVLEYPPIPNEFYLELNTIVSGKGKLRAELGWGQECTGDNQFVILGVMEKSPEQVGSSGDVYYSSPSGHKALPWYYKQCQVDRSEGLTQSFACQLAINERSQLNRLSLDIVSKSFSPYALNYTYKFETALKYYLYPNMEVNPLVSNPSDRTRVVIDYIETVPEIPLTNVYIYKPDENIFFEKLYTPYYQPISALQRYSEVFWDQFFEYDYIPECNLMEDYISTFDNVTYEFADNRCQYLLAQGGIHDNTYAVLFSQLDPQAKTKVVVVSAAGRTFKLMPPHGVGIPIEIDGQSHVVTAKTPLVLDFHKYHETFVYVHHTPSSTDTPILILHFPKEYLTIRYDGKNVKVQVSHLYKGNQEGLCGDFNGEYYYEFQGPDECVYVESDDFVDSYAIPGQSCPAPPKPDGPAFCPADKSSTPVHSRPVHKYDRHDDSSVDYDDSNREGLNVRNWDNEHDQEDFTRQKLKAADYSEDYDGTSVIPSGPHSCIHQTTEYIRTPTDICFTVRPVHECSDECKPKGTKKVKYGFHCLPRDRSYVRDLMAQADEGLVEQVLNKSAERYDYVTVPETCSPRY